MDQNKTIFVTGATGKQGGAVARKLIATGYKVIAITRDPSSPKANELKGLKIEVVKADLNDPSSYSHLLKDIYGVFSVQSFEDGVQKEILQGINLAKAAKAAGIQHFIYSSVAAADLKTGIPHFDSKWEIEKAIRELQLPFTIIRPASLYENLLIPQIRKSLLKGKLMQLNDPGVVMQYVSAEDVGNVAVKIFNNKEAYIGRVIELATEEMNGPQLAAELSKVMKIPVVSKSLPALIIRLFIGKNVYKMSKWLNKTKRFAQANLGSTHKEFDLLPISKWIEQNFQPVGSA